MKNYTSLGSSPNTNYLRFDDTVLGGGYRSVSGSGSASGSPSELGGLTGFADNLAFKKIEKYNKQETPEMQENGEIIKKSDNLYTTENIIQSNLNFVHGEIVYRTIVIPFYVCLIDIIIMNDLYIEIVDNSSIETKNKILGCGKIRKYRLNGLIKNYDIFIEMENENVYHVKKRGIMMRVRVSEDIRQLILNTMVNYVADGGDLDPKQKSNSIGNIDDSGGTKYHNNSNNNNNNKGK